MNKQKLELIASTRFKNLRMDDGVKLDDLTIFIGPNCSGKSNVISMLNFLKDCVATSSEDEQGGQYENAVSQLGGTNSLDKNMTMPSDVIFRYRFSQTKTTPNGLNLDIKLFIGAKNSKITIKEESLYDSTQAQETPFYYYRYHDREVGKGVVSYYDDSREKKSHFEHIDHIPNNSLGLNSTHKLLEESEHPPERTPVYKTARELIDTITNWHFYNSNNMNLKKIRTSEPKIGPGDIYLSKSGHNLALVIDNLIQQDIDFEDALNKAMRSILPTTRRLRPARTRMSVNLEWHFQGFRTDEPFYLDEMSDGAVRMLCWATVLLSPKTPALLVIDEPELGLHVSWMPVLAEWIKMASEKTQVIISTHSPDLLDCFTDQIGNVRCFSSADSEYFSIHPLSQSRLREKLDAR